MNRKNTKTKKALSILGGFFWFWSVFKIGRIGRNDCDELNGFQQNTR